MFRDTSKSLRRLVITLKSGCHSGLFFSDSVKSRGGLELSADRFAPSLFQTEVPESQEMLGGFERISGCFGDEESEVKSGMAVDATDFVREDCDSELTFEDWLIFASGVAKILLISKYIKQHHHDY